MYFTPIRFGILSRTNQIAAFILACVAGGISRTSAFYPGFFSGRMHWSWPPSSEGLGEESS